MERNLRDFVEEHEGSIKWGVLGATIIALELVGNETLTEHARRAINTKIGRVAVPAAACVTALHITGGLQPEADPFHYLGQTFDKLKNRHA